MEEPWTILELAELAADALAATQPTGPLADAGMPSAETGLSAVAGRSDETAGSAGARLGAEAGSPAETATSAGVGAPSGRVRANGRVRDVPNERLVRWYVTVGLVDPPLSRRGRVARYGRRHLLQLVAVKRRQAEGRSLAEIQAELAGATDETLAAVARLTDPSPAPQAPPAAPDRFWARQPREPGPAGPDEERPGQTGPAARSGGAGPADAGRAQPAARARWLRDGGAGATVPRTASPDGSGRRGTAGRGICGRAGRRDGSRGGRAHGRACVRDQARAGGDGIARGRGPRAGPGRFDRDRERRGAAAQGTGQQGLSRLRPGTSS